GASHSRPSHCLCVTHPRDPWPLAYSIVSFLSVELTGFEPVTPTLPVWCATSCAIAPLSTHVNLHPTRCFNQIGRSPGYPPPVPRSSTPPVPSPINNTQNAVIPRPDNRAGDHSCGIRRVVMPAGRAGTRSTG